MADGGGQAVAIPLTADLVARAIIAAAVSYGDDPVKAMTCGRNATARRSITAAAGGLIAALGLPFEPMERVLKVRRTSIYAARTKKGFPYRRAVAAVVEAVRYATKAPAPLPADVAGLIQHREPPRGEITVRAARATEPGPAPAKPANSLPRDQWAMRDLILDALAGGPLNSMSLAFKTDRKEMAVSQTLTQLEHEGLVVARNLTEGPRRLEWALAA